MGPTPICLEPARGRLPRSRSRAALVVIAAAFLLLAIANARTKAPWSDEAGFANPGLDLITRGSMGMSVSEPAGSGVAPGTPYKGIDRNVYAGGHLHFILAAGWFKLFGFSVLTMRSLSMAWGLLLLAAWYTIVRILSGRADVAALAVLFIGLNHVVVDAASDGRPDIDCAALGAAALAVYLALREERLTAAVVGSQVLLAAAALCHPTALVSLVEVLLAVAYFDRKRLRFTHLAVAAGVYAAIFAPSVIYILSDRETAAAQFAINSMHRLRYLASPLAALRFEIAERYLNQMYLPSYASGAARLRMLVPGFYLAAVLGVLLQARLRRHAGYRLLLLFALAAFLVMTLFEGNKSYFYLVQIVPLYCVLGAVWLANWKVPRGAAAAVAVACIGMNVAWIAYNATRDGWHREYNQAVACVADRARAGDTIFGPPQMGFAFGFYGNLVDDASLGYFTGKTARFIITDHRGYQEAFAGYPVKAPYLDRHVRRLLSQYTLACENRMYRVYVRNE